MIGIKSYNYGSITHVRNSDRADSSESVGQQPSLVMSDLSSTYVNKQIDISTQTHRRPDLYFSRRTTRRYEHCQYRLVDEGNR